MNYVPQINRRSFVVSAAAFGGGLALGMDLPFGPKVIRAADGSPELTAWVVIKPDDGVVIRIARSEMGQGSMTGLAQLVAGAYEVTKQLHRNHARTGLVNALRGPSEVIWIRLPSDFGTPGYARRRVKAITSHLSAIGETRAELLELFDNWLAPSVGLRQYLWAHRRESIETARKLIELIPPVTLKTVLSYLVLNYWGHRSGWPDLLVYRTNQWFLAEVKSCSDKLNENQKRWIENNHRYLHLPFKLVQVARGAV